MERNIENQTSRSKQRNLTLRQYVKRRTGVSLGGKGSLSNMLKRSLGAGSFAGFWRYWNPIWGFYLGKHVFAPLKKFLPLSVALIITFVVSGAIHDLAIMLVKREVSYFLSIWFFFMGLSLVVLEGLNAKWTSLPWFVRAITNLSVIILCFALARLV